MRPAALCWTLRRGARPSCQDLSAHRVSRPSGDRATTRAQLAELLWPEEDADKSHANLRQLIARIRAQQASLGFRLVDATPSTIRLAPVNVRIDLADILERLRSRAAEDIQELCSLYGGDLLEDAERETDAGRDWIALRRAHLRETVTGALCRFLEEESGADDQLILAAERLLEIDPYQEAGYRALMRVYARLGQKYQVRRVFELCQSRLFADLETGPAQETSALFHELAARRAEGWRAPTGMPTAVADVISVTRARRGRGGCPAHLAASPVAWHRRRGQKKSRRLAVAGRDDRPLPAAKRLRSRPLHLVESRPGRHGTAGRPVRD